MPDSALAHLTDDIRELQPYQDFQIDSVDEARSWLRFLDMQLTSALAIQTPGAAFEEDIEPATPESEDWTRWELVGERIASAEQALADHERVTLFARGDHILLGYAFATRKWPETPKKAKTTVLNMEERWTRRDRQTLWGYVRVSLAFRPERRRWSLPWAYYQRVAEVKADDYLYALDSEGQPLPGDTPALQDMLLDWIEAQALEYEAQQYRDPDPQRPKPTRALLDMRIGELQREAEARRRPALPERVQDAPDLATLTPGAVREALEELGRAAILDAQEVIEENTPRLRILDPLPEPDPELTYLDALLKLKRIRDDIILAYQQAAGFSEEASARSAQWRLEWDGLVVAATRNHAYRVEQQAIRRA